MKHNPTHLSVDVSLDTSRLHALPAFFHFRKFFLIKRREAGMLQIKGIAPGTILFPRKPPGFKRDPKGQMERDLEEVTVANGINLCFLNV